jgi:hypothetical protein
MTLAYLGRTSSGSNSKFMELKYFWIKDYLDSTLSEYVFSVLL